MTEFELATLGKQWPDEFRDGARCGFLREHKGPREPGGYPLGFKSWPLARRNAWFAGFNQGLHDRRRLARPEAT